MKTQIELAREGLVTSQMETVARNEHAEPEEIRRKVASGEIVIASHPNRKHQRVVGIGSGLRTKVNGSIGTSSDICDIDLEVRKARAIQEEGADLSIAPQPDNNAKPTHVRAACGGAADNP